MNEKTVKTDMDISNETPSIGEPLESMPEPKYVVPILGETRFQGFLKLDKKDLSAFLKTTKLTHLTLDDMVALQDYARYRKVPFSCAEFKLVDSYRANLAIGTLAIKELSLQGDNPAIRSSIEMVKELEAKYASPEKVLRKSISIGSVFELAMKDAQSGNAVFSKGGKNYLNLIGGNTNSGLAIGVSSNISESVKTQSGAVKGLLAKDSAYGLSTICLIRRSYTSLCRDRENYRAMPFSFASTSASVGSASAGTIYTENVKSVVNSSISLSILDKSKVIGNDVSVGDALIFVDFNRANKDYDLSFSWLKKLARDEKTSSLISKVLPLDNGLLMTALSLNKSIKLKLQSPICDNKCSEILFEPGFDKAMFVTAKHNAQRLVERISELGFSSYIIGQIEKPIKRFSKALSVYLNGSSSPFISLPLSIIFDNSLYSFNKFQITEVDADADVKNSPKKVDKKLVLKGLKGIISELFSPYDFSLSGKALYAPFGGKFSTTLTPVQGIVPGDFNTSDVAVVFGVPCDIPSEKDAFNNAVYNTVVAVEKLVSVGVSPFAIGVCASVMLSSNATPSERGDAYAKALGVIYASRRLNMPILDYCTGSYKGNGSILHTTAIGSGKADSLISNVFSAGNKVFRLSVKKDKFGTPDFKYLLRLLNSISINIETKNIESVGVIETTVMDTLASCISGNGKGIFLNMTGRDLTENHPMDLLVSVNGSIDEMVGFDFDFVGIVDDSGYIKSSDGIVYSDEDLRKDLTKEAKLSPEGSEKRVAHGFYDVGNATFHAAHSAAKPKVLIPGLSNSSSRQFEKAFYEVGAHAEIIPYIPSLFNDMEYIKSIRRKITEADILVLASPTIIYENNTDSSYILTNLLGKPQISDAISEMLIKRDGLIYSSGDGLKSLIRLGFLPYGKRIYESDTGFDLTLLSLQKNFTTSSGDYITHMRAVSNNGPWMYGIDRDATYSVLPSGVMGKFVIKEQLLTKLYKEGQIGTEFATQYGIPSGDFPYNPTGSINGIESILSPDGRIIGKLGHPERFSRLINISEDFDNNIFKRGVDYFK